jgi:hypothetical protein
MSELAYNEKYEKIRNWDTATLRGLQHGVDFFIRKEKH